MKLLTNLSATLTEGDHVEPRGNVTLLHDEPVPGFFRRCALGSAGLVLSAGPHQLAIPLAELWALAEQHHAGLLPPGGSARAASGDPVPSASPEVAS